MLSPAIRIMSDYMQFPKVLVPMGILRDAQNSAADSHRPQILLLLVQKAICCAVELPVVKTVSSRHV